MQTRVNSKGKFTLSPKLREQLGIKDGTYLHVEINSTTRQIILTPITREFIHSFRGKYKGAGLMKAFMKEKKRLKLHDSKTNF